MHYMSYIGTLFSEDLNQIVKHFQLRTFKPTSPGLCRGSAEEVIKSKNSFYKK